MDKKPNCPDCGRELTGAIEATSVTQGDYVFIVNQETSDCNWTQCGGCKMLLCKPCRIARRDYCCDEGRIVDHECVRAAIANSNPNQNTVEQEEALCRTTKSSI